jgi:large subunit ribosomal protein L24
MAAKKKPAFEGKLHIRTGDNVIVLIGKDKGKTGKVTRAYPKTGKVVVEGINIATKHVKGRPTATNPNPESGRIQVEAPILASKVALVNAEGKPTRVRIQQGDNGAKTRVATRGGAAIATPTA